MNNHTRIIGLTGGIGTGKTTVSNYLASQYQLPVLDADIFAREAVQTGSPILREIFERYGDRVKLPNNHLNRQALGEIIFNNTAEKRWLESKIHPYVRSRFSEELAQLDINTIVFVIPLLFEANLTHLVTEIWVVSCDRAQQIQRLQQRNGLTTAQAINRIDSQIPLAEKIAKADVALDNNSTLEKLFIQIDEALKRKDTELN
ncbi:Dephospho-CoA kinase [Stanieria cyanosphaera PCC 7437]|uniref:Dephospho-CoA kinase n=1 Tax=Stanieria cyanosphaera (strain ATCC 29371 / PCC 7437) TaxID=111780 RepID=K9XQ98_STAC7|nr:dephospho-CoA kinase [Stanieria cyanosphaera]AFZ34795.1 Dephospho-CoA kinase [Stanieria cyanosphaera PCC 7437]